MSKRVKARAYAIERNKPVAARERVAAYRKRMRAKGYKPVEVWVPDTSNPKFIARFRRQCRDIARRERQDKSLTAWLDANADDLIRMIEEEERDPAAERPV